MILGKCACAGICLCGAATLTFSAISCMFYPHTDSVKTIEPSDNDSFV